MENNFYGKKLSDLSSDELQLLSIDIQLSSLVQRGEKASVQIAQGFKMRTKAVNECINMGGNYSRDTFLSDNGFQPDYSYVSIADIKELGNMMEDITKHIKGFVKEIAKDFKKRVEEEPDNGKEENGFQMN